MTADLVEFLRARLADDERAAQAAEQSWPSPWRFHRGEVWHAGYPNSSIYGRPFVGQVVFSGDGTDADHHVARHDPARVLREVAAKRAILGRAVMCKGDYWRQYEHFVLKPLAAVYDDHPEYRAEWKV